MRIAKSTLEKLENILKASGYLVRFEKGNFRGGYCLVKERKTVIVNKFYPLESQINSLAEVVREVTVVEDLLTDDLQKLLRSVRNAAPAEAAEMAVAEEDHS